jgi:hypothetical protein
MDTRLGVALRDDDGAVPRVTMMMRGVPKKRIPI